MFAPNVQSCKLQVLLKLEPPLCRNGGLLIVALVDTAMYSDRYTNGDADNGSNNQEGDYYLDRQSLPSR